jgi:hypothetical protein
MGRIGAIVAKEIREALPATIFFIFLFHMIGLTKDAVLEDYSFTALRSAGATLGALIVAKAILLVDALPISRLSSTSRIYRVFWKTLMYGAMVLVFRFVEELITYLSKHNSLASAIQAMFGELSWPLFTILSLWVLGGLFLYCLTAELVRAIGMEKIREVLLSTQQHEQNPDARG